jgi:hypothetical protein
MEGILKVRIILLSLSKGKMLIARFRLEQQINKAFTHSHLDKLTELATTVLERQSPVSEYN